MLYNRAPSAPSGAAPTAVSAVVSEKTVIPEEITVKVDSAEMGVSEIKVIVGFMLRRGRGCWEA